MRKTIALTLAAVLCFNATAFAGLGSKKAAFVGGSTKDKDFPGAKKDIEGELQTGDEKELRFVAKFNNSQKTFVVPYNQIIDLEYGQKAGRRVGAALATAILISPVGLFLLFSKKRKHFLTIGYKDDEGKEQVVVFELGKDIVRTTLAVVEARSGKKIEYQDEEAKKSSKGN
jgi:hypothetical protein